MDKISKYVFKASGIECDEYNFEGLDIRIKKTIPIGGFMSKWHKFYYCLYFVFRLLSLPIFIIMSKKIKDFNGSVVSGFLSGDSKYWNFFVQFYYNKSAKYVGHNSAYIDCKSDFIATIKRYFIILYYGVLIAINLDKKNNWIIRYFEYLMKFELCKHKVDDFYVFYLNHPVSYMLSIWLEKKSKSKVFLHLGNNPIFLWNYPLPFRSTLIASSVLQLEEIKYLKLDNIVDFCPDEFILDTHLIKKTIPTVDIGIFSSAEWSRLDGLYRTSDLEGVASYKYAKNKVYERFFEGLILIKEFAIEHDLVVKIYPHPHERWLIAQEIIPPYLDLIDDKYVFFDASGNESSRERIYETKVAISYHSSFIWERLTLGLTESYHFEFEDDTLDLVNSAAIGKFKDNLFKKNDELIFKLSKLFR